MNFAEGMRRIAAQESPDSNQNMSTSEVTCVSSGSRSSADRIESCCRWQSRIMSGIRTRTSTCVASMRLTERCPLKEMAGCRTSRQGACSDRGSSSLSMWVWDRQVLEMVPHPRKLPVGGWRWGGETYRDGMSPLDHFLPWQRRP